jgi:hypothetical protein
MRPRLWLVLVLAIVVLGGGVAHEALAGGDGKPVAKGSSLTASQKAARKRLADTAAFLEKNNLTCGCQHHFPPATATSKP